jgi:sec-independent protein translocase protein TatB
MFDVGFSEMLVIGVVALVVIGPEKLPRVARTLGHLMGRAQRYVNEVKRDIDREVQLEDLRKLQADVQTTAREIQSTVETTSQGVQSALDSVGAEIKSVGATSDQTPTPTATHSKSSNS